VDNILGLSPTDKEAFSAYKAQLDILYEPLNRLRGMAMPEEQFSNGGIL